MRELSQQLRQEVGKVVVGQEEAVEALLAALCVGGHVLLEGVPGVAKTLLAAATARALGMDFRRVQFTPDMLPSDLTGTMTLRGGDLVFRPGPVFTNLLLADEVNRTPPKTQAALLEAMQEGQVSVDGRAHPLPDPFLVVATQNPVEYEGTYPLPEAQLDRFHVRLEIGYPSAEEELAMLAAPRHGVAPAGLEEVRAVGGPEALLGARAQADSVRVSDEVAAYVVAVVRQTRELPSVSLGASPRAAVHLLAAARAAALVAGRDFVTPDDVAGRAGDVLRHRLVLAPEAELEGYGPDRVEGPLGLAAWHHEAAGEAELLVYPDLRGARRLVLGVREGRFRDPGTLARGPLGLGTEFESVRDYLPDDDVRQVNWPATARAGRPMSNQYRIEQDRDVLCLLDCGRLMSAPVASTTGAAVGLTRLDAAVDAAAAVALVADELGDRCGGVAFDDRVRRRLRARRNGGAAVVRALFDLEPGGVDSDYELAFRMAAGGKRALVVVLTDLLDEAAARALVAAVPVLARHHALVVASCADPDLAELVRRPPRSVAGVHAMAVAVEVLDARARVVAQLRRAGAQVLEAPAGQLAAACVRAYLAVKRRARM